jgi:hypothetical protein
MPLSPAQENGTAGQRFPLYKLRVIIVSSIALCLFLFASKSPAAQLSLAWDPPDIATDVVGYMIHYGTASGTYSLAIDAGYTTTYTVSNLIAEQTYFFVVTAYNAAGYESVYSNEVSVVTSPPQYLLMTTSSGTGQGTISGPGISCGATCLAVYDSGTVVSLSASAATGSTFGGWSGGGCSGTGPCTVTMNENTTITANFKTGADNNAVYATFGSNGLYKWDGAAWSRLNTKIPDSMVASGSVLYAAFASHGLYKWDGTIWSRLNAKIPASMAASGSVLYAAFTGLGLHAWDGSAWSRINGTSPTSMTASGSVLYATFAGSGLYMWDGAVWSQINTKIPESMAASDSVLYATFAGSGLHAWNGNDWTRINGTIPTSMTASDSVLYATFAGSGLYVWDGAVWSQINKRIPESMAASGSVLYATFAGLGLYAWNGNDWTRINGTIPTSVATDFCHL